MILPIRTSIRAARTPYINYALIVANIIVFFLTYIGPHRALVDGKLTIIVLRPFADQLMLHPTPHLWQFLTYAFLHGSFMHIFGNMYFLYLFGNTVNSKLGHINYLLLYLAGAVFAGLGHILFYQNPVLGASGAVAAVTGAYLVLFPQTLITILYWFFFIGTLEISALYFILFKLIFWDNIIEPKFAPSAVAYSAHLAGYAFGIIAIIIVLATGLVPTSGFDLWSMVKQWNRRRRYRNVVTSGYDPYTGTITAKPVKAKEVTPPQDADRQEQILQIRNEIGKRIAERNLNAAAELYLQLMQIDNKQIPPRQYLLDIANQLASETRHTEAAQAYEKFLDHYSTYEYIEQVQLMLGIIYSRYLDKPNLALKYLQAALGKLTDQGQIRLCREELAKIHP